MFIKLTGHCIIVLQSDFQTLDFEEVLLFEVTMYLKLNLKVLPVNQIRGAVAVRMCVFTWTRCVTVMRTVSMGPTRATTARPSARDRLEIIVSAAFRRLVDLLVAVSLVLS